MGSRKFPPPRDAACGADFRYLPSEANPTSTGSYPVKTDTNTAAYTNPINEQRGCPTGLGHRASSRPDS
jgi:hypothetical protein